ADLQLAMTLDYDDLYRLTAARGGSGEVFTYRYDDAGNLTFKSDVGDYRYGEGGAARSCLTSAGSRSFTYTAMGEMATTPWGRQSFDALGRLRRLEPADGSAAIEFTYGYTGERVLVGTTADDRVISPDPLFSIEGGTLILNLRLGRTVVARQP